MPYEETVERRRFHSFCKVVLRHEMLDCFREFSYQNKWLVSLNHLPPSALDGICTADQYIPLGGADGAKNADFLCPFLDGNQGDDADHNGGDNQRNRDEGNQHIGNGVDDGGDGRHHQAHIICVLDLFQVVHHRVVIGNGLFDDLFVFKGGGVDVDGGWVVQIHISKLL